MKNNNQNFELITNSCVPQPLLMLWAIVEPDDEAEPVAEAMPNAVFELATKIRTWTECDKARTSMNRTFAGWRMRSPQKIMDIVQWLNNPNTRKLFNTSGAYGARIDLVNALTEILSGIVAHAAFGQNKNKGRPRLPGFTRAYDAALYAEYLFRIKSYPSDEATFVAVETFNAREELVKTERTNLKAISDNDITNQAILSCHKHCITP